MFTEERERTLQFPWFFPLMRDTERFTVTTIKKYRKPRKNDKTDMARKVFALRAIRIIYNLCVKRYFYQSLIFTQSLVENVIKGRFGNRLQPLLAPIASVPPGFAARKRVIASAFSISRWSIVVALRS